MEHLILNVYPDNQALPLRNVLAVRKVLWKYRLGARKEDVGKDFSRTVKIEVDTGNIVVSSPRRGEWNL